MKQQYPLTVWDLKDRTIYEASGVKDRQFMPKDGVLMNNAEGEDFTNVCTFVPANSIFRVHMDRSPVTIFGMKQGIVYENERADQHYVRTTENILTEGRAYSAPQSFTSSTRAIGLDETFIPVCLLEHAEMNFGQATESVAAEGNQTTTDQREYDKHDAYVALMKLLKHKGRAVAQAMLQSYGVRRLDDLSRKFYPDLIMRCKVLIENKF